MRNEAMGHVDVLVGSWQPTVRNAWFLGPADQEVTGSAAFAWTVRTSASSLLMD
jgi:hypothetical protein